MSFVGLFGDVAGYYRDIKVAEASKDGTEIGARVETVPDQAGVGVPNQTGVGTKQNVNVAGMQFNKSILFVTGGVVATLVALKFMR